MKLEQSKARETKTLWEVRWWPSDWGDWRGKDPGEPCKSYCVAPDMNAAFAEFSDNPNDLVSVTRVHNGGVTIAEVR